MSIIEKIQQELHDFQLKKAALIEELRKEFPKLFSDLLKDSKKIESFSWTQYSPYFNDGEECVFSTNTSELQINGINPDDLTEEEYKNWEEQETFTCSTIYRLIETEQELVESIAICQKLGYGWSQPKIGSHGYLPNPDYDITEGVIYETLVKVLDTIPEDFYRELFGNHVQVTVHKNGKIDVETYDHE